MIFVDQYQISNYSGRLNPINQYHFVFFGGI